MSTNADRLAAFREEVDRHELPMYVERVEGSMPPLFEVKVNDPVKGPMVARVTGREIAAITAGMVLVRTGRARFLNWQSKGL